MRSEQLRLRLDGEDLSAIWQGPEQPRWQLVLAHGAGAGMRHVFMADVADGLASRGVATLRYQFPYTEAGRKRPDRAERLRPVVRAASKLAQELAPELPCLAGGKSMGGRMTTQAQAEEPIAGVRGLALFCFPLHPAGKPEKAAERAEHLAGIRCPMWFASGTRDRLAPLASLRPVLEDLHDSRLCVLEDADHGFAVRKRSGLTYEVTLATMLDDLVEWADRLTSQQDLG